MITFRSDAGADVMMFDDVASRMLGIIDKEGSERGVVTVEELPSATVALRSAAAADRMQQQGQVEEDRPQTEVSASGSLRPYVSLNQRAVPLIELFERSIKRGKPVFWGC